MSGAHIPRYRTLEPTSDFWAWRDQAACIGHEDLFYSTEDELKGQRRRKEDQAKTVCATCPVLTTCREFAMQTNELYGVWGGLTEIDRHNLAGRHRTG